jgi:diguanylate cyclase (GGDEF)-like protein
MKRLPVNLLTGLVLSIVLLGIISAAATLITTRIYRDLTFDFERQYMSRLLAIKSSDILLQLERNAFQLGLRIQASEEFRTARAANDEFVLSAELEQQFKQGLITAHTVTAVGLYAFDLDFNLLGVALRDTSGGPDGPVLCPDLASKARLREGPRRLQPASEICLSGNRPYQAVIIPVGGLDPSGYLQVVSDPAPVLYHLDKVLNMPIRVELPDNTRLYETPGWGEIPTASTVVSDFIVHSSDSRPAIRIAAARNAHALVDKLDQTDTRLIAVVIAIILVSVATALWFVKYSVFKPLQELSNRLRGGRLGSGDAVSEMPASLTPAAPASFQALGELYETLRDRAIRDPLTGTYNRALLEDRLKQAIAEHRRTPTITAVMLVDLVRFKYVNDLLGHHTGDLLLKQVVGRLAGVLRESDTLARLGGDEFAIILPDTDGAQACQVAQKIMHAMESEFEVENHTLSASVSIGIALMPRHGEEVETLLRHADYAMYAAKKTQSGYTIYNPNITEEATVARMALDGVLNENIERNDLFIVYQPVLDFRTDRVSYLEALVRWRQPDGRILLPETFIRVAEQSGLIRLLSEWIINTACRELVRLQQISPGLRIGINLSMHNLHDYKLTEVIGKALERYRLASGSLLLEITETGVMLDPNQVIEILNQLSSMGLTLSIDDFGTGHSSLAYLKRLPVHTLKVDKSFVIDMDTDDDNASIVHATIDLAHNLGLTVTAEGVETQSVYESLKAMGCDYYQGYYVGEPMESAVIIDWLNENRPTRSGRQEAGRE